MALLTVPIVLSSIPVFHQLITSGYITEVRLSDWILLLVTPFIVGLMLNHYIQMYS
ncbi:MAG: hypothetical protein ACJAV6_000328, partial [Candidatus Paceibacteria bacterium]